MNCTESRMNPASFDQDECDCDNGKCPACRAQNEASDTSAPALLAERDALRTTVAELAAALTECEQTLSHLPSCAIAKTRVQLAWMGARAALAKVPA